MQRFVAWRAFGRTVCKVKWSQSWQACWICCKTNSKLQRLCGKKRLRLWQCSQTTWGWWAKALALFLPFNSLIHQTHQIELAQAVVLMFFVLLSQVPQGGDGKTGRGPPDWCQNDSATCSTAGSEFRSLIGVSVCGFSAIFNVGSKDFTSTFDNYISDKLHKPLAILSHHRLQVLTALFWKKAVHCLCIVSDSWRRFCSCHRLRRSKSDSKSMARDSKSLFLPICCCSLWNFVLRLLALVGCSGVPKARSTVFSDKYCPL